MAAAPSADVEAVGMAGHEHEHDEYAKNEPRDDTSRAAAAVVVDQAAERSLCFKFDVRLMPVLSIMCKFASLNALGTRPCKLMSRNVDRQTCSTRSTREI